MTNYEIADHFSLLSKLMEVHSKNPFKAKSYSIAAYNIEKLPVEIADMNDAELFNIKGIGEAIGKKIREIEATGKLSLLEKMVATTPEGIMEMLRIKGLGPKKIAVIWKELEVESLGELEYACNENRLVALKGFGKKTQDNILQSIAYFKQNQGFHLWAHVELAADSLLKQLQQAFPANQFAITGDIRRQVEIIEYIEIVADADNQSVLTQFNSVPDTTFEEQPDNVSVVTIPSQPKIKIHFTNREDFYKTLFLTTGSSEFLSAFFNAYKLPDIVANEEEIFSKNNLQYIQPALRETAAILEKSSQYKIDGLIEAKDIKGIIHSHSTWSDGSQTIAQMAAAAKEQGFEYLVISDHSQAAFYAQGLTPERLAEQHHEIDKLNEQMKPFKIFKSIEADILNDGRLDYNDRILSTFDLVIASVHSNLKMPLDKAMSRVITAIENPFTTILGHPTGRILLSRQGYPLDHKKVIDACAANDVVIEINAHPRRLDIDWRWIEYALEKGVLLSINPDAHATTGFQDVYYGAKIAQKGGLTAKSNLSSFTLSEFENFLAGYKSRGKSVS